MDLTSKFHSYLERYRCAVTAERDLGPHHPETIKSYEVANEYKVEFQNILKEVERRLEDDN